MRLYRPVAMKELDLICASGWKAFPPRLPEQPIFYPVTNYGYARQIATKWNATHDVIAYDIDGGYISGFDVHTVGLSVHQEYWIPAEELDVFNAHILGMIELVSKTES